MKQLTKPNIDKKTVMWNAGYNKAKEDLLEEIDEFIRDRTYLKNNEVELVRFMPFEWRELKEKIK